MAFAITDYLTGENSALFHGVAHVKLGNYTQAVAVLRAGAER